LFEPGQHRAGAGRLAAEHQPLALGGLVVVVALPLLAAHRELGGLQLAVRFAAHQRQPLAAAAVAVAGLPLVGAKQELDELAAQRRGCVTLFACHGRCAHQQTHGAVEYDRK
jgi:hypothetical protein